MSSRSIRWMFAAAAVLALSACGGSGGGGTQVASTPTPPPPPPPTPPPVQPPVRIFANPAPIEYASVGASVAGPGGNLDTYDSKSATFGTISASDGNQAHIRYNAGGYYEIELPGAGWDQLVHYKGLVNPTSDNNYFQPQDVPMNLAYLVTSNARDRGFTYSELGSWGSSAASRWGYVAFGVPTPEGAVPTTGSATFQGYSAGSTDIMVADNLYRGYFPLNVDGTVELNFNFGAGTLGGSMTLSLPDGMNPVEIGTWAFRDTVYSAGSTTYSGSFDTTALGQNFFLGRFTGPSAEETIGAWALPFVFDKGGEYAIPDGQTHQAFGAWIAKRGN